MSTLRDYAFPHIGGLPVSEITSADVLRCLEPIWTTKTETASRVRMRIEKVRGWATVKGYRSGDNPARWVGYLAEALPKPSKVKQERHHGALPRADLPAFMVELKKMPGIAALALQFVILTAAGTGDVIGATWEEIDLDGAVWTIPASRMKVKDKGDHHVALTGDAVALGRRRHAAGSADRGGRPHRAGSQLYNSGWWFLALEDKGQRPGAP